LAGDGPAARPPTPEARGAAVLDPAAGDGSPDAPDVGAGGWWGWPGLAAATGLAVLAVLWGTVMPGVGYWDTAEAQAVGPLLGTMHPTGFPAYVVLGWFASIVLAPLGEPAFRMNLLSAILVAAAAAGTILVGRRLRVPLPIAVAAGVGLALTPVAWRIGTIADAHALHLLLVVSLVLALLGWERRVERRRDAIAVGHPPPPADRWLVVAAAIFGVSIANHSLTLLLVPPVGLYVLAVEARVLLRPRLVAAALLACFGTAALLYLELPLRAGLLPAPLVYGTPGTWDGFWYVVLAEQFRGSIVDPFGDLAGKAVALGTRAIDELGPLAALLPVAFVLTAWRAPRFALLSGLATAITVFFAASYVNADIGRYYLGPAFFAWTWLAVGAAVAVELVARSLHGAGGGPATVDEGAAGGPAPLGEPVAAAPGVAPGRAEAGTPGGAPGRPVAGAPGARTREVGPSTAEAASRLALPAALMAAALLLAPTAAALPERHEALDRSDDRSAGLWLDTVLEAVDRDAVIVSWWSYSTTLWYGTLVEGRRPDVRIVDDRTRLDERLGEVEDVIDANLGSRPVYVIRASNPDVEALGRRYVLDPVQPPGGVYRVVGAREPGA
jgi:hypothetical protein